MNIKHTIKENKKAIIKYGIIIALAFFAGTLARPSLSRAFACVKGWVSPRPIVVINVDPMKERRDEIRKSQDMANFIEIAISAKMLKDDTDAEEAKRAEADKAYKKFNALYNLEVDRVDSAYKALVGDENGKAHMESLENMGKLPAKKK